MIHFEKVSFDGEKSWYWLTKYQKISAGKPLGCGLIGGSFLLMMVLVGLEGFNQDVKPSILTIIGSLMFYAGVITYFVINNNEKVQDKKIAWNKTTLKILDVQRVDSGVSSSSTVAGGVGLHLGFGLMVGGGGGHTSGTTTTVIGWQFYVDGGVMVVPDAAYSSWLAAGKPETCRYALKDSKDQQCKVCKPPA